jgi:hypothetical protein
LIISIVVLTQIAEIGYKEMLFSLFDLKNDKKIDAQEMMMMVILFLQTLLALQPSKELNSSCRRNPHNSKQRQKPSKLKTHFPGQSRIRRNNPSHNNPK